MCILGWLSGKPESVGQTFVKPLAAIAQPCVNKIFQKVLIRDGVGAETAFLKNNMSHFRLKNHL